MKVNKNILKKFFLLITLFILSSTNQVKVEELDSKIDYKLSEEFVIKENNLIKLGKYQEAILELEKKLVLQPENPVVLTLLGKSYDKLNKKNKSLEYLTKAITVDRNYPKAYNTLALIKGKENKFQETINLLDAAIKLDDNYAEAFSNRGVAKGALNKNIEAINDFTKAIEINPFLSDAYINRGITYELLGNTFSACEDWETAASLGRKEPEKWFKKQCKNSLENKLSKQIKLTETLRKKNVDLINKFSKEKKEDLSTINKQNLFIEKSSNKLLKLEEKLDSLLNSKKEENFSSQENNLKLKESNTSSQNVNNFSKPSNILAEPSNIASNNSNIITDIKSQSQSNKINKIVIFTSFLILFIIIAYLYLRYIRKLKFSQSIQKKRLNLLTSNVDSLNRKLEQITNNKISRK